MGLDKPLDKDSLWELFERLEINITLEQGAYVRSCIILMPLIDQDTGELSLHISSNKDATWLDELGICHAWQQIINTKWDSADE